MTLTEPETAQPSADVPWGPRGTAAATFAGRLSFVDVCRSFGTAAAVKNVSIDLEPGEILCLLGPSGCGKTTLLRMAAGVEQPSSGQIILAGQEVAGPNVAVPPEKRGVGLMFQDFALFPHLTILENVAFGLRNLDRKTAREEASLALRRVGLEKYAKKYPHVLSGGEQQRVALARAIVPRPAVILMDEPFSGLDQRLRDSIRAETLALLKETRATCMLVTHDPQEAMWLADRIALMRAGRLVQLGSPSELYQHPVDAEAARFFSDFNEFDADVANNKINTPLGVMPAEDAQNGSKAHVMIRPQGIVQAANAKQKGFEGYVSNVRFVGDSTVVMLNVEGLDQLITARLLGLAQISAGEVRKFTVLPEYVLIFS